MSAEMMTFPELSFEEKSHVYKLNGIEIPSVTALMKPLSERVYGTVNEEVLAKAAERGTAIHNAIENFLKFGIEDIEPRYSGYFEAFLSWWSKYKPEPISSECRVYHKILRYAGTSDLICNINGSLTLVDYKSSAQVNGMLCGVQLEGYDRAWESQGIKLEDKLILHLRHDGSYEVHRFPRGTEYWQVLSALMTIQNYVNKF